MRTFWIVARTLAFLAYPFVLYAGLERGLVRAVGLATAGMALVTIGTKLPETKGENARALLSGPVIVLLLGVASACFRNATFVLAMPVLVNAALFSQFATSLRETPIVERFARMIDGELSAEQVAYCRTVTLVWCGYFVVNGTIAAALAATGALAAWALHTGILGYVGMGVLGGVEYLVRKAKFRKFSDHFFDRALARMLPPKEAS